LIIVQSPFPAHSWPGGRPWSSLARRLKCHSISLPAALFRIAHQPPLTVLSPEILTRSDARTGGESTGAKLERAEMHRYAMARLSAKK